MRTINALRKVIVRVGMVCMGVIIVDTAYNTGKRNAYRECLDLVKDEIDKLENENEEEAE